MGTRYTRTRRRSEGARGGSVLRALCGKPIDADVTLYADEANYKELSAYPELAQAFSVSNVTVKNGADGEYKGSADGVSVTVEKAASEMCERCWSHDKSVGSDEKFPHLCARCAAVMKLDLG